jgi:hypothetical protein
MFCFRCFRKTKHSKTKAYCSKNDKFVAGGNLLVKHNHLTFKHFYLSIALIQISKQFLSNKIIQLFLNPTIIHI